MEFLVPLFMVTLFTAITIGVISRNLPGDEGSFVVRMFTYGMILRVGMASVFLLIPSTRIFHEDAVGYEWIGVWIARSWRNEVPPIELYASQANYGYYYASAILSYIFGPYKGLPSFFNSWLGGMTGVIVFLLSRRLFHQVVARRAMKFALFFPSTILWSTVAAKDQMMVFLIVLTLYSVILLRDRFTFPALLGIILPLAMIFTIRFYIFYILLLALGASFVLFSKRLGTSFVQQMVVFVAIAVVMVAAGLARQASQGGAMITLEKVAFMRAGLAGTSNSGFMEKADVSTPAKAIAFLPIGITFLLLSPFPWQFTGLRSALTLPEMLVWWAMLPAWIRGIRFALKYERERLAPIFVFAVILTMGYATFHGNVGVAFRQRTQITIFLYIFGALGYFVKRARDAGLDPVEVLINGHAPATPTEPTPTTTAAPSERPVTAGIVVPTR